MTLTCLPSLVMAMTVCVDWMVPVGVPPALLALVVVTVTLTVPVLVALRVLEATLSATPVCICRTSSDSAGLLTLRDKEPGCGPAGNSRRLALPAWGELKMSAADGPVGDCVGSVGQTDKRLQSGSTCHSSTQNKKQNNKSHQGILWIWISCLRSNEPCAVKAGPLPPNVNTAQNAAMKWIKLKVSSQTVTLQ
jgi:hypothetical protein